MIQDIAPHRLQIEFQQDAVPTKESTIFLFKNGEMLFIKEETGFRLPRKEEIVFDLPDTFLFRLDGESCFLEMLPEDSELCLTEALGACRAEDFHNTEARGACRTEDFHNTEARGACRAEDFQDTEALGACRAEDFHNVECLTMRGLRGKAEVPREALFAAWTAGQLARWYAGNRFCGACGTPTRPGSTERSLICPKCGKTIYPRINPAIIAGVTNGDEIVLTRYKGPRSTFNALVAGFVEIGETLEDTVHREVMEETGLRVKNLRYYKSQPWSIADDLLAGFFCDVDGPTEIHMDAEELSVAKWTRREDVVLQPDDASLTNEMMKLFRDGKEPRV